MVWQIDIDLGGYPLDEEGLRRVAEAVLAEEKVSSPAALSIVFCAEEGIVALNQTYLGRPWVTDVLAFSLREGEGFISPPDGVNYLGEVIICYPQAVKQAGEWKQGVSQEVALLLVHGILHLLGFDDGDEVATQAMRQEEARLLNLFPGLGDGL